MTTPLGRYKQMSAWDPDHKVDRPLKSGDLVRISIQKGKFEKGSTKTFSNEHYIVDRATPHNPNAYHIKTTDGEPVKGKVYRKELQRLSKEPDEFQVEVLDRRQRRGRPAEVLVRWIGYFHQQPQWIPERDLVTS
jgi:hypothetical protein